MREVEVLAPAPGLNGHRGRQERLEARESVAIAGIAVDHHGERHRTATEAHAGRQPLAPPRPYLRLARTARLVFLPGDEGALCAPDGDEAEPALEVREGGAGRRAHRAVGAVVLAKRCGGHVLV